MVRNENKNEGNEMKMKLKTKALCGKSHGGNDRLTLDRAGYQCCGCGSFYTQAQVAAATWGQKGSDIPYFPRRRERTWSN